jgi:hypothetical protein
MSRSKKDGGSGGQSSLFFCCNLAPSSSSNRNFTETHMTVIIYRLVLVAKICPYILYSTNFMHSLLPVPKFSPL